MSRARESCPSHAEGGEAVCFTAGIKGPAFSAGVVHAWLAADRKHPKCVAGISFGAIAAAAMQRAYRELEDARRNSPNRLEAQRWTWFRRYLDRVTDRPLSALWKAIPHPDDLSADREPVVDNACPPELMSSQTEARWNYYALMRLGQWIAGLRIRVRSVGRMAVTYVRFREGYGAPALVEGMRLLGRFLAIAALTVLHVVASPQWCRGWAFSERPPPFGLRWLGGIFRVPLFGWPFWLSAAACVVGVSSLIAIGIWALAARYFDAVPDASGIWAIPLLVVGVVGGTGCRLLRVRVVERLGIKRGLLHDYHARRELFDLFQDDTAGEEPLRVGTRPMPIVIVAAPLQELQDATAQQLFARADGCLITALRAAVAIPGLFAPVTLFASNAGDGSDPVAAWLESSVGHDEDPPQRPRLDLVDGSVIRHNPLPALFHYLKHGPGREMTDKLESRGAGDYRIHIVYSVPVEPLGAPAGNQQERLDIVETGLLSAELAARRDTKLERRQTNFISEFELMLRRHGKRRKLAILADDIAPEREIRYANWIAPDRDEALKVAAQGCRRTLGVLYRKELQTLGPGKVPCSLLLRRVADSRAPYISDDSPGLSEICRHCDRTLRVVPPPAPANPDVERTFGFPVAPEPGDRELVDEFSHLSGETPRIVFVASGGVFRGATHIGVLAAMRQLGIRPDLVVGASVGTLMGSGLAALSTLDDENYPKLLDELCRTFYKVDERVALTAALKGAARQLGVRARRVALSPRELSRKFNRGARSDLGIATIGAPAELIDALSMLLLIPYADTHSVAASFVGGKFAEATRHLLHAIRAHTLRRLGIEHCLIGTSLLEPTAKRLMGELEDVKWPRGQRPNLRAWQPYHAAGDHKVSFFSTATSYRRKHMLLLGRDVFEPHESFDFVKANLCSSAFPAIFAPIREAEVFPGTGSTTELFGDGGMFDNLPFFPAIEILAQMQKHAIAAAGEPGASRAALRKRWKNPDLIVAAALDESPSTDPGGEGVAFEGLFTIRKRASVLKNNLKIDSFRFASETVSEQLREIMGYDVDLDEEEYAALDTVVNAATLKIEPTSGEHLNPTFAFSRSTGLNREHVRKAIADGCYTTMLGFLEARGKDNSYELLSRAIEGLGSRIPKVELLPGPQGWFGNRKDGICPYFRVSGKEHRCPFFGRAGAEDVGEIYGTCRKDSAHRERSAVHRSGAGSRP